MLHVYTASVICLISRSYDESALLSQLLISKGESYGWKEEMDEGICPDL